MPRKTHSPIGTPTVIASARRGRRNAEYRAERERLASFENLARWVIKRRSELGLTQEQLAERMGTSHSAISRIESGQHAVSAKTVLRLASALDTRLSYAFEHGPADKPVRELVPA